MLTHNDFIKTLKSNLSQSYWDKINSELTLHGFKSASSDPIKFIRLVLDNPDVFRENYLKSCRTSRSVNPTINAWENMLDIPEIKNVLKNDHRPLLVALKDFQKNIVALLEEKEKKSKRDPPQKQSGRSTSKIEDTVTAILPMSSPDDILTHPHINSSENDIHKINSLDHSHDHCVNDIPQIACSNNDTPIALSILQNVISKLDKFEALYNKPHVKLFTDVLRTDINLAYRLLQN